MVSYGNKQSEKFKRFRLKGKATVFIDWANVHGWEKSLKQLKIVKLIHSLKIGNWKLEIILVSILFLASFSYANAGVILKAPPYIGLNEGLVGYWSFDGPDMSESTNNVWALDRSGNGNNGVLKNTATSTARVAGKIGQALDFDGSNDYVDLQDPASLNLTGAMTISAWVYSDFTADGHIVSKRGGSGTRAWAFEFQTGLGLQLIISSDCTDGINSGFTAVPIANEWHHIVGVYEPSVVQEIYVDGSSGVKLTTGVPTSQCSANGLNANIGRRPSQVSYFPGKIDEVRIYNRVLSPDEIKRLYKIGSTFVVNKPRTDTLNEGLVGYWSFDGPDMSESTNNVWALDRSGNGNNGVLKNTATSTARVAGKIGQALDFDGSNDYVNLSSVWSLASYDDFTFSAWYKSNQTTPTDDQYIFVDGVTADAQRINFGLTDDASHVGEVRLALRPSGTTLVYNGTNVVDQQWHHLVGQRSGNSIIFYTDGVRSTDSDVSGTITPSSANTFMGDEPGDTEQLNGILDEVRIYNRALSPDEIKRLYKIGSTFVVNKPRTDTLNEGLVGYWSFDGPDMSESTNNVWALDRSGNGNNGVLKNTATSTARVAGKIGQALDFDGSNDYVSIPFIFDPGSDSFSFFAWVRLDVLNPIDTDNGTEIILQQEGGSGRSLLFRGAASVDGTLNELCTFLGGVNTCSSETIFSTPGSWYHVGVTYDQTTANVFVNGSQDGSAAVTGEAETGDYRIGRHKNPSSASEEWNGLIDEVRIYNRVLSQEDITRLYNMGR